MEKMAAGFTLSGTEIKKLFEFAEKKLVHWYDLQIELVDHLASGIETEMISTPGLTFEQALEKIYQSFGIFGFAKIVQERQHQLAGAAKKRWWTELKYLFRWPAIMLVLLILSAVWTISLSFNANLLSQLFFIIYISISLLFLIYLIKDHRLQKNLLLMQSGATYFSLPFVFEFVVMSTYTHMTPLSFTLILTMGMLIKLTSFRLYSKIRNEAEALYPAAFLK